MGKLKTVLLVTLSILCMTVVLEAATAQVSYAGTFTLSDITSTSIRTNWTNAQQNYYSTFRIYRNGTHVYTTSAGVYNGNWNNTGLTPNTQYHYQAKSSTGGNPTIDFGIVYTLANMPDWANASAGSTSSLNTSWGTAGNPGYTNYNLYCTTLGTNMYTGTGTTYTHTGLISGKTYSYEIKAKNESGTWTSVRTFSGSTSINTPSILVASSINTNRVTLSWDTNGNSPGTNYELYCNTTGQSIYTGTGTTYIHTGLTSGKIYSYKVRAVGPDVSSPWTMDITAATEINIPSSFGIDENTLTSITLSWEANGNSADTVYELYCNTTKEVLYSGTDTTYTHSGVFSGTAYSYKVKAIGPNQSTAYTQDVAAATLTPDTAGPGIKVKINNGAAYTWNRFVNITVEAVDNDLDQIEYRINLNGEKDGSDKMIWWKYDTSGGWSQIPDGSGSWGKYLPVVLPGFDIGDDEGEKCIFVDVRDKVGNTSQASAIILYIPDLASAKFGGSGKPIPADGENLDGCEIGEGDNKMFVLTSSNSVELQLTNLNRKGETEEVVDNARYMLTSLDGVNWSQVEELPIGATEFQKDISFETEGKKAVYIKFRNSKGVDSSTIFVRKYLVDSTAPVISANTKTGARATSTGSVDIQIDAFDNVTPTSLLKYRFTGDVSEEEPYQLLPSGGKVTCDLSGGTGQKIITVRVIDEAGNVAWKTITIWRLQD